MKKEVIQNYDIEDFKDILIVIHSSNSFTISCTIKDEGHGLIDIDFYNDGNSMEVSDEIYFESEQLNEFIDAIRESIGIGDWCEKIYKKIMCGSKKA